MHLDSFLAPTAHLFGSLEVDLVLKCTWVANQGREALVVVVHDVCLFLEFIVVYKRLRFELQLLLIQQVRISCHLLVVVLHLLAQPW